MIDRDYLVFWRGWTPDGNQVFRDTGASVVRLSCPPHDEPRGRVLDDLAKEAIAGSGAAKMPEVLGVVELPPAQWSRGAQRAVSLGTGKVAALECGGNGWALHL